MLDLKDLRSDPEYYARALQRRGFNFDLARFQNLETERRQLQQETETLQAERNHQAKAMGQRKAAGESIDAYREELAALSARMKQQQQQLETVQIQLHDFLLQVPNIVREDTPDGLSEEDNKELRRWGEPAQFDFTAKDHVDLAEAWGLLDNERASKLSGARYMVLKGPLARLHRALSQFMLNMHSQQHGYTEMYVPCIVQREALLGTGQLPKFSADLFALDGPHEQAENFLIPTAEVPLTNLHRNEILDLKQAVKYVAHTPCFRSEAGSYGKDTRGLIRQHQFDKVELVQIVQPSAGLWAWHELIGHAEAVLQALELPYRVVNLCAGDLGFSATATHDLEVWLPGQNCYREISSCSLFGDFQARRLKLRYREEGQRKPEYAYTVNGSGLAVGRTLVAILENGQQADGSVRLPSALHPYMGGQNTLSA